MIDEDPCRRCERPEQRGIRNQPPTPAAVVCLAVCFVSMILVTGALTAITDGNAGFGKWFTIVLGVWTLAVATVVVIKETL